jgi:hypothetical protein
VAYGDVRGREISAWLFCGREKGLHRLVHFKVCSRDMSERNHVSHGLTYIYLSFRDMGRCIAACGVLFSQILNIKAPLCHILALLMSVYQAIFAVKQ